MEIGPTTPLVSIVTASFNNVEFLQDTIDSVRAQDYPNIEHIIIDGGSSDGTLELLKKNDDRITWISESDNGTSDAMNKGMAMAKGEILACLHSDDFFETGCVSAMVQSFADHPAAGLIYGDVWMVNRNGDCIEPYVTQPFDPVKLKDNNYICQAATFFTREVWEEIEAFSLQWEYCSDYDFLLRASELTSLVYLPVHCANWRLHGETRSVLNRIKVTETVMKMLWERYNKVGFSWIYSHASFVLSEKLLHFLEGVRPDGAAMPRISFILKGPISGRARLKIDGSVYEAAEKVTLRIMVGDKQTDLCDVSGDFGNVCDLGELDLSGDDCVRITIYCEPVKPKSRPTAGSMNLHHYYKLETLTVGARDGFTCSVYSAIKRALFRAGMPVLYSALYRKYNGRFPTGIYKEKIKTLMGIGS
ncbi:MAG: glycosyltransferase [Candidatus Lindowbacteria bacterium]|nr:glycosyltransferase [Candidatus Lindowbacteria bacterium]